MSHTDSGPAPRVWGGRAGPPLDRFWTRLSESIIYSKPSHWLVLTSRIFPRLLSHGRVDLSESLRRRALRAAIRLSAGRAPIRMEAQDDNADVVAATLLHRMLVDGLGNPLRPTPALLLRLKRQLHHNSTLLAEGMEQAV